MEYFKYFDRPDGQRIVAFFESLNPTKVRQLISMPATVVNEWFQKADLSSLDVDYAEFEAGSFALMTNPLGGLWQVYKMFYDSIPTP